MNKMPQNVYWKLFIFCAFFSEGIAGTFLKRDVEESSNVLVREKRVINREPGGDTPTQIKDVPFVVNIKSRNIVKCVGSILSHHTVLTAARCVVLDIASYTVHSGSTYSYHDTKHHITDKKMHGHNPSRSATFITGIALITVNPPFVYSQTTGSIGLHSAPVLTGMHGTVSGWASYIYGGPRETNYSRRLRSITVPIMRHQDCVNIYKNLFPIGDEDICTYHEKKQCGHTDGGAPLVINNELAGVHIGAINTEGKECPIKPDVFVLLQHLNYGSWIRRNIV